MPKVSVIIPSYNYAKYLPECVKSVLDQSFSDCEAVIVDDGSSDNTEEVAAKLVLANPARVRYYRTENLGVTHARNFAIEKSSAEYILPLDADDLLVADAVEEFVKCIESSPRVGFAYSALQNFGEGPDDNNVWEPGPYNKERLIWENLAACTSMWRRELFLKGIKYRKVIFEDWDMWLQIAAAGYEGKYIPKVLFKYRIHHSGRNTTNKNRYMQSLVEEIHLNPALYNPGLTEWARASLVNFPECLNKPSIVFLPDFKSKEFTDFSGELLNLARDYLKRGHFVVSIGDYRQAAAFEPGLILISYKENIPLDLQAKREIYKLGREVIVFNGQGKEIKAAAGSVNNVKRVIDIEQNKINLPKISVVTVSYNQAEFIKQNIDSVLSQYYPFVEHLVIDGGSSDGTLEILKSYRHLNWVSEPDRGQTHALNKGFDKASGEIIAWLNSDDWLPEDVFFEVADKLKIQSVLIGACQVVGKNGDFKEFVPNVPRSWYDTLKYWIFYSSPSQPSIFFKKSVLEEFKLKESVYLDEDLDFCMDYEFWLRIGRRYPLTNYTAKVLSYCRTYDTNKTGRDMDSVYREMSRVFSRYSKIDSKTERSVSFVIPVNGPSSELTKTLHSIEKQKLRDYEVLVVDYGTDNIAAKQTRRAVIDYEKKVQQTNIRYIRSLSENYIETLNQGFDSARAEYVVLLPPGAEVGEDFTFEVKNTFRHDVFGLGLFVNNRPELSCLIKNHPSGIRQFNLENIFSCPWIDPMFVARKTALREISGIQSINTDIFLVNHLVLNLMNKGWQINVENKFDVSIPQAEDRQEKNKKVFELTGYFAASVITEIIEDESEFAKLRARHGFALVFSPEMIENSKMIHAQIKQQVLF